MEKKKKVGTKVKNTENKPVEKKESNVVFNKTTKKYVKILSLGLAFFAGAASVLMIVFGIIVSSKVVNLTTEELANDNFAVTFVSNISHYSFEEAKDIVLNAESKTLFIFFDIVIPVVAFIAIMTLLVILARNILNFINDVTTEDDLFQKRNVTEMEKFACLTMSILTINVLVFDTPSIIVYLVFCLFISIILGLFKKTVKYKK